MFEDIFRDILRAAKEAAKEASYQYMEYDCHSNLTDEDMIKIHIDFALENGDKEMFMQLTGQLKEVQE